MEGTMGSLPEVECVMVGVPQATHDSSTMATTR
jgi:hypothetical protein